MVGQFFGASKGLGFLIATGATNYKVDMVFAGVAIFMGLSLILTMAVKKLESNLSRWRPEEAKPSKDLLNVIATRSPGTNHVLRC